MKILTTALYSHAVTDAIGSGFMNLIGNRLYEDEAPEGSQFPYCVYKIIVDTKEWQFVERFESVVIQFSFFSTSSSANEIKAIYLAHTTLYDECTFTMAGDRLLWCWRDSLTTNREEHTTPQGTFSVRHYAVDYDIFYEDT